MNRLLFGVIFVVVIGTAGVSPAGATTLNDLLNGQTLTAGNFLFDQFGGYTQLLLQGASPIAPSNITVSVTPGSDGLVFALSPEAYASDADGGPEQDLKYTFTYRVTDFSGGSVDSATASFDASASGNDAGNAFLNEDIVDDAHPNTLEVDSATSPSTFTDSTPVYYEPLTDEIVTTTFLVDAVAAVNRSATASLSDFTETFTAADSGFGVVEPRTFWLLTFGLAALISNHFKVR